jgi:uncharacterized protein YueI
MCILLEFIYLNIIMMHGPMNVKKKIMKLVLCQKKNEKRICKNSQKHANTWEKAMWWNWYIQLASINKNPVSVISNDKREIQVTDL